LRSVGEVIALKQQPGKDIYLIGGLRTAASLIDAGVVDELRLITYPLIAGTRSDALFATAQRQRLAMCEVRPLEAGQITSTYRVIR
jgi:dihydrofolate reductase